MQALSYLGQIRLEEGVCVCVCVCVTRQTSVALLLAGKASPHQVIIPPPPPFF